MLVSDESCPFIVCYRWIRVLIKDFTNVFWGGLKYYREWDVAYKSHHSRPCLYTTISGKDSPCHSSVHNTRMVRPRLQHSEHNDLAQHGHLGMRTWRIKKCFNENPDTQRRLPGAYS